MRPRAASGMGIRYALHERSVGGVDIYMTSCCFNGASFRRLQLYQFLFLND